MNLRNKIYWLGTLLSLLILSGCDDSSRYMADGWDLDNQPPYLQIETDELIFESSSYETPIVIGTNAHWAISTPNSWITFSETSGKGSQTVIATISAFLDSTIREGKIIVRGSTSEEKQFTVVQTCDNYQPWLSFTCDGPQTLQFTYEVPTLEYSVNGSEWQELGTKEVAFGGNNGELKLRGKSSYGTYKSLGFDSIKFSTDFAVSCKGDIRTLVDYQNYRNADCKSVRFCGLFNGCHQLICAPDLPATALADDCYYGMFWGCTSLTSAPELPATTLADGCYFEMFWGCTSLTSVPMLPATALADWCYKGMFNGCTSLTSTPKLPATTLATACYEGMFNGCTSLTSVPELPATMLAGRCYYEMFSGCSSLTAAPNLPANTLNNFCYYGMFDGCTSLISAPVLPATTLAGCCYYGMFKGCTSLTAAPDLPATTLDGSCYCSMFNGCTSLKSAPDLPALTLVDHCYEFMFYKCKNLQKIKMMATDISAKDCLADWTWGVAATGTFIKNAAATWDEAEVIPSGWTVITE